MKKTLLTVFLMLVFFSLYYLTQNKKVKVSDTTNTTEVITNSPANNIEINSNFALEVLSPKDKTTVSSTTIKVSGKTAANADVFVNEKELKADLSGNFSVDYELFEGENNIYVSANDDQGNHAEKSIIVYLESIQ